MVKLTPVGLSNDTGSVTLIDVTGLAIAATNTVISSDLNNTSSTAVYPTFVSATTGKLPQAVSSKMTFIPSTGTLTATTFNGALTGTADYAKITTGVNTAANFYPAFVTSSTSSTANQLNVDTNLTYNAGTNTLTTSTFNGALTGTADYAKITTGVDTAGPFYPAFATSNSSATSNQLNVDTNLTYNASTNTLTTSTFSGSLSGNAGSATKLETTRTIGGVSFNGESNINLPGVNIAGSMNTSGTATTATNVVINNATNDSIYYPTFATNYSSNSIAIYGDSSLVYTVASSIGTLTCGKFNATGGADFAEYMKKTDNGLTTPFNIEPGDICGIDKNGLLTNVFSDSFHFCVKSTSPCIIAQVADNTEQMEPIAFCGRVPVNVFNCRVGDYIIPIEKDVGGGISGMNIQSAFITFDQYRTSLGKVIRINEDGTAEIVVKIV